MDLVIERAQLTAIIDSRREEFRQDTCTLMRIFEWPRGRWYCRTRNGLLFVVTTNHPLLNYLHFENYVLFHDTLGFFPDDFRVQERVERHPMSLDSTISSARQNSQHTTWQHFELARHYMEEEHRFQVLLKLLEEWNPERYLRLVTHRLDVFMSDFMYFNGFNFYIETMRIRCEDSYFIIHVFRQICTRVHEDNSEFLSLLSEQQLHFFMRHLKRVDYSTEVQQAWLRTEDLLRNAFLRIDKQIVRDALEVGGPSSLLPSGIPLEYDALDLARYWPRGKDGIKRRSFNSCEYYVMFTDALVCTIIDVESDRVSSRDQRLYASMLKECIELLWRAVPTPHLPIEDMRTCMSRFRASFAQAGTPEWQRAKSSMWTLMELFFGGDQPTVYGPRRLQHLCRVSVRQWCRSPEGILRLPLPKKLTPYMNLES